MALKATSRKCFLNFLKQNNFIQNYSPHSSIRCFSISIPKFEKKVETFPSCPKAFPPIDNEDFKYFDCTIVGGGIVGLATAYNSIKQFPNMKYCLLEKESDLAQHQSGHNSNVIHAGIYYIPGSLKAKLCVEGLKLMYKYCDEHNIPYKKCGKLIVATTPEEIPRLDVLHDRGLKNEVPELKYIENLEGIKEIEPNCLGLKALHSPHTGIVDFGCVAKSYGETFKNSGGKIFLKHKVNKFDESKEYAEYPVEISVEGKPYKIRSRYVITCAGLHSDKVAKLSGGASYPKIVPFRGEYLLLKKEKCNLVRGNIYPVPNPKFPFLGVHFTPRMNGDVWLGPNAVLAFKREGYKFFDLNISEFVESVTYPGLLKLIAKNIPYVVGEVYRGAIISSQVNILKKLVPDLNINDVTRGPAGVRAQALSPDGSLVDDFVFDSGVGPLSKRTLHIRNAPSPGATSSLAIARLITEKASKLFNW